MIFKLFIISIILWLLSIIKSYFFKSYTINYNKKSSSISEQNKIKMDIQDAEYEEVE